MASAIQIVSSGTCSSFTEDKRLDEWATPDRIDFASLSRGDAGQVRNAKPPFHSSQMVFDVVFRCRSGWREKEEEAR